MEEGAPGGVQSIARAFYLLELINAAGGELAISELADRSGLPLPTIHRIIRTLITSGYVIQQSSRRYALGPRLIGLGETASRALGAWARPRLTELVEAVGETANMAILDGDKAVYIAQVPSKYSMRMFTEVGRRVDLHCTGVGKALLAQLPPANALEIVRQTGMPASTVRSITDPDELMKVLARVRELGYAIDHGEQEIGVRCVAVPVTGAPTPTTISVSGPETRLTPEVVERVVPHLLEAAAGLDRQFRQPGTQ
ncbi:IclR family transcriptional regulator [Sphaerisporangium perillae]|uniref:IclR family transcriptional regulator n=1 Tax=Sphaerisporangium perillae TaxID=2935860 RepID=UPI0020101D92|nr:IclR family transcriptional regulator [Sphaerisporangium perillae]